MTIAEIHATEQMEAAKEEFDRLWREATTKHSAMAYMLSALAYLTARTLAREVFVAMLRERGMK